MYGGIPEGGGYGSATEYEVAAHRIAEAIHCILGSLGKAVRSNYPDIEIGHINEEAEIIKYAIDEDAKDIYIDRVWEESPDKERSYQQIVQASQRLKSLSLGKKSALARYWEPKYYDVAIACYDALTLLAIAMLESVADYPQMKNAFTFPYLRRAISNLITLVKKYWVL
jgi:hypothetical protein